MGATLKNALFLLWLVVAGGTLYVFAARVLPGQTVFEAAREKGGLVPLIQSIIPRKPCEEPLSYRIGTIDESFGIARDEFQQAIEDAEALWEKDRGRDLFAYREDGTLPISLLFDDRQAATLELKDLLSGIRSDEDKYAAAKQAYDAKNVELAKRTKAYETSAAKYEKTKKVFKRALSRYNEDATAYDRGVAFWNARGGAPEEEYKRLESEREDLEKTLADLKKDEKHLSGEYEDLERERKALNRLVKEANDLTMIVNRLAKNVNAAVMDYNQLSRSRDELESGVYESDGREARITVYQFYDHDDLVLVLAHELGHALGLEHGNDPQSLMYPMLGDQPPTLSEEDRMMLRSVCGGA